MHRTKTTLGLLRDVVQESSANYWYEKGKRAIKVEEWDEAQATLERSLILNALHWRAHLQLALVYTKLSVDKITDELLAAYQSTNDGWDSFTKELSQNEWNSIAAGLKTERYEGEGYPFKPFRCHLSLVLIQRILRDFESARQTLEFARKAFKLDVTHSMLWHRLSGAIWYDTKEWINSITDYDTAIKLDTYNSINYISRGRAKHQNGMYNDAVQDISHAIDIEQFPNSNYYWARGDAYNKSQNYLAAIADYDQAITLNPVSITPLYSRGLIKRKLKEYDGALSDFNKVIELNPSLAKYYLSRASTRLFRNDELGAISDYSTAIKLKPEAAFIFTLRSAVKSRLKDYKGALSDLNRAIELESENDFHYIQRAFTRDKLGDEAGATIDRQKAADLKDN